MARTRPLVIGHRGAPGYRPEHTRTSYELAISMGVDAVEPDVVVSRDGVLVVRHENEIGSTTDVAEHPEFADRRTTRSIDGEALTGWFTEDFTWDELVTLRCRERLPLLRPGSASHDDAEPMLRLRDLLDLVREASFSRGREIGIVLEIKHATHFGAQGWDVAGLVDAELRAAGWGSGAHPLVIESFEQTVLERVRDRGIRASYVYLLAGEGRPFDLVVRDGDAAPTYVQTASPAGLDLLAGRFDGISVDKALIVDHPASRVVDDAHARGLQIYTWTCRPENAFLSPRFRRPGADAAFGDYEGEWTAIRDAGIDGVFVDHADLGVAFFGG
ncbi:glycerophosphodiester phosphodiesterase family protein [Microbacterium rhizomatis]|uniref:glycerophosphodiester phosphodiesterase n=1 Tax=Microbacterium rhizomatis TaxID=1631477 RepID=A0A5J5J229_9MICO|nr:glycerophosphodiester phosphodiesterase family protein [Microbacterium rhizomatis]KAA9107739.1 glycerophosphodiester phosphodiesterase [Microbacterium rhizomatis]